MKPKKESQPPAALHAKREPVETRWWLDQEFTWSLKPSAGGPEGSSEGDRLQRQTLPPL